MRLSSLGIALALVVVAGCGNRYRSGDISRKQEEKVTLIGCPQETDEVGAMPPAGTEMWCNLRTAEGLTQRHGPTRQWWKDGRQRSVGAYANNERTGHWWYWDTDGRLEKEGDFREDAENGWWIHYRPDGSITEEGPMVNGGREGVWTVYDDKTGIPTEGLWVAGEKEGTWIEYDAEGKPIRERVYRRGRLINQREL